MGSAYKREQLVGIVPHARISYDSELSFILALERTQLVLVADDVATKQAWVAASFAILERKATAIAIVADAAAAAMTREAQVIKDAAKLKMETVVAEADAVKTQAAKDAQAAADAAKLKVEQAGAEAE